MFLCIACTLVEVSIRSFIASFVLIRNSVLVAAVAIVRQVMSEFPSRLCHFVRERFGRWIYSCVYGPPNTNRKQRSLDF